MTTPTHAPIKQAWVRRMRSNPQLVADLKGGIHEGFAPEKAPYPFAVYNLVFAPYDFNWGDLTLIAGMDCSVFSRDSVEANNLDAAIADWMSDQPLPVDGQRDLLCRRSTTLPTPPDIDDQGKKVYQVGGSYEIWTDAPIVPRVIVVGVSDEAPAADSV